MTDRPKVARGYIADAGLCLDAAKTRLNPDLPFDANDAHQVLQELTSALDDVLEWAREVNRAPPQKPHNRARASVNLAMST